jgi:hypothetical protein
VVVVVYILVCRVWTCAPGCVTDTNLQPPAFALLENYFIVGWTSAVEDPNCIAGRAQWTGCCGGHGVPFGLSRMPACVTDANLRLRLYLP